MKHATRLTAAVLAAILVSLSLLTTACAPWKTIASASTPEPTPSASPSPTPTPTPTPVPTPTPMPELTLEQKKLLLGINEKFEAVSLFNIDVFNYNYHGENRRVWVRQGCSKSLGEMPFYNLFNGEFLFSIKIPGNEVCTTSMSNYLYKTNPLLEGITLTNSCAFVELPEMYVKWKIKYNASEELEKLCLEYSHEPLTKEQIIDLYFATTYQNEIPPFWEYVPNAKIPDEFVTPSPESSSTTAP